MPTASRCRAHSILQAVVLAMISVVTTNVAAQDGAADGIPSAASHITRPAADMTRPVAVIDRRDIELSGMTNLGDLLLRRSVYNSFGIYRPFVLGSGRVAILVNGRRISDSTFDFDALPISAVERVEILSDTAAALHGGHAIGGAVNIVLRRGYEGIEVQAGAARPTQQAGGDSEHGSALLGGALGRGHLVVGVDTFRRQEIRDADRDYGRASWMPGGSFADASGVSVGGNTVFISTTDGSIARPLGDCEGSAYASGLTNPFDIPGTGCGFAYSAIKWHWERLRRDSVFLNADYPLVRGVNMYLDARTARGETDFRYAPSVGSFSFAPSEDFKDELLEKYPEIKRDDLKKVRVFHRFVAHDNRDWQTDMEEHDLSLGVRGRLYGVGYDAHLRYYLHDAVETGDTFVSRSAIVKAIGDGRYDIENPFSTDPDHLAAVRETGLQLKHDQVTEHRTTRVSFNGAAFPLSGGHVLWAAGTEVVSEDWRDVRRYRDINDRSYDPTDVLGSGGTSTSGERRRWSTFAEVSIPLLKGWDLTLAGRRDDHDDVGETFSGQVASRYRLNQNITLRASWGTGARVPGLGVLHVRDAIDYPFICDRRMLVGDIGDCDRQQVERVSDGNPNLKPDDAESLNIGAMASLGPFSLSLDWFRINLSDVPTRFPAQSTIDLEAKGRRLPSDVRVIREGDVIRGIESKWFNIGETDVEGLDLRGRIDWKTDLADMAFDLRWSHVIEHESRTAGEKVPGDYPRDRVHASLRTTRGGIIANWNVHAVSDYWNTDRTARYEKWIGHDITLGWHEAFGLLGLKVVGGVLNIGDRGPSTDSTNPGINGADVTLDSALGRTLFLKAKVSFRF